MQARITSRPADLILAMNLLALAVASALHPHIRYAENPLSEWVSLMVVSLGGAGVLYGLYALVFRERGRAGWPKSFLLLAWFLMLGSWVGAYGVARQPVQQPAAVIQTPDAQVKTAPTHRSEIDRFLDDAPPSSQPGH